MEMETTIQALVMVLVVFFCIDKMQTRKTVKKLSINSNFGCLNKAAMEMELERRRPKSGSMALVGWDVAGMGKANSLHGEEWVNTRVMMALDLLKFRLRRSDLVLGQKNSGDEFLLLVPQEDVEGVMEKVIGAFWHYPLSEGVEPIYIAWVPFEDSKESPVRVMEEVYKVKKEVKGK